jgi:CcmD family protein
MEHFPYLLAAYSVIFGVLALYLIFLGRRQAKLQEGVRAMEARLAALNGAAGDSKRPAADGVR